MTRRAGFAFGLLTMIACSIAMAVETAERCPGYFLHAGAKAFLVEPVLMWILYAGAIGVIVANRGAKWDVELRNAAVFGGIAGACEVANVTLENGIGPMVQGPAVQVAGMVLVFALWGVAAARTAKELKGFRPGLIAAVMSAGVCMVIGVAAGFAVELLVAPPLPGYVVTWAEFKRSEWSDAHAFAIANTLDSGFTHLWMGPLVALVVGSLGSWIGRRVGN